MSDLSNAIPVINAYFPAGLRRCVNVRKVCEMLAIDESPSHWFTKTLLPLGTCVKDVDYVIISKGSAPLVLDDWNFYKYDGPRCGSDILCAIEKIIPAVRETKSSNSYVVAKYLSDLAEFEALEGRAIGLAPQAQIHLEDAQGNRYLYTLDK